VDRFMEIIGQSLPADWKHLYSQVTGHVNELSSHDVEVIAFKKQNNVGIFYFCHSLAGLQHLYDLYSSGKLKCTLKNVFTELLNDNKLVFIASLHWDIKDFTNCM
jgi:hypothetical protein